MKRALIVGIDKYPGCPLYGCVNDAQKIKGVLSRNYDGTLNFQCEILTAPLVLHQKLATIKLFFRRVYQ